MGKQSRAFAGALVPLTIWLASISVAGQTAVIPAIPAEKLGAGKNWTPPRTQWGDPDLQGYYNNTHQNGTPVERPDQYAGRRLDEVQGEELVKVKRETERQTTERNHVPLAGPGWWESELNLDRGTQAWLVVDPPDGKIPPQTPAALQRAGVRGEARRLSGPADSYEARSLYDRCISRGLPGSMMPAIYGNSYQIVQSPGYVAILYEMIHETRVIPLGAGPHVGKAIRTYMGDPRGHWEGNTLVVETVNFRDDIAYRGANGKALRLTERFSRISPDQVKWTVTVDDSTTWTRPWTFAMPLTRDDKPVPTYECHEGNYAMSGILAGARADEKAAEEAGKRK